MVNPFKDVNWNPGPDQRRTFARSLLLGFPCLGALLSIIGRIATGAWNPAPAAYIAAAGAGLGALLLIFPGIARPFYVAWYAVACAIGLVVGNVLLGAIYFFIVTVLGCLIRIAGHRLIRKSFDKNASTYWRDAEPAADPERYFSQF
ncbi:MAG: hypothetical protein ACREIA_12455 [Opitutaceae bacterium]